MKPTDTRWEADEGGEVNCVFRGDQCRRTIAVSANDFPLTPWRVAGLMNAAFALGVRAKGEQVRKELGF